MQEVLNKDRARWRWGSARMITAIAGTSLGFAAEYYLGFVVGPDINFSALKMVILAAVSLLPIGAHLVMSEAER